jgi:CRP-like cAMP-binding protein
MISVLDKCRSIPVRSFEAGQTILGQGDRTGRLYVLAEGRVAILKGGIEVARADTPGAMFGEMSVLLGLPHSASVVALGPVAMHVIDDAEGFLESTPGVALAAAHVLAQRLHDATSYLADLKSQFEGVGGHFGMIDRILGSLMNQPRQPDSDVAPAPDDPRL